MWGQTNKPEAVQQQHFGFKRPHNKNNFEKLLLVSIYPKIIKLALLRNWAHAALPPEGLASFYPAGNCFPIPEDWACINVYRLSYLQSEEGKRGKSKGLGEGRKWLYRSPTSFFQLPFPRKLLSSCHQDLGKTARTLKFNSSCYRFLIPRGS